MQGSIPYWGANGVVDYVNDYLFDEQLVLLGEDGAPFHDPRRDVAFLTRGPVWINNHIHVLRPKSDVDPRYLTFALNSIDWPLHISGSTRDKLTQDDMMKASIALPGVGAQRAIADYLDIKTARIDALVAKKQQLETAILQRERALIEHRLLARSDGVIPLRRLLEGPPQYGATESGEAGDPTWPRYLRITDLTADGSLIDDGIKRLPPEIAKPFLLDDNDLLFARSGATSGKAYRYRASVGPACFAGYLIRFKFDLSAVIPEIVEMWTQTAHYWGQVIESTVQATIQNVSADKYMSLGFPRVHRGDQSRILSELRIVRARSSHLVHDLRRQIDLLREHKQALITAAVTGEVDAPGTT